MRAQVMEHRAGCSQRVVSCEYCSMQMLANRLEQHKQQLCQHAPLKCEYGCGVQVPRAEATAHQATCTQRPLPCVFAPFGCTVCVPASQTDEHHAQASAAHAALACQAMLSLQNEQRQQCLLIERLMEEVRITRTEQQQKQQASPPPPPPFSHQRVLSSETSYTSAACNLLSSSSATSYTSTATASVFGAMRDQRRDEKARRNRERTAVRQIHSTELPEGEDWYIIDAEWWSQWRLYVIDQSTDIVPGPISNHRLLMGNEQPTGLGIQLKPGLRTAHDYCGVNGAVWALLHKQYGVRGSTSPRTRSLLPCPSH